MYEVRSGERKIAVKIRIDDIKEGLSFFTDDTDFIQLGTWRYSKGKKLAAHNHNVIPREVNRTQEFIYVVKGSLKAFIYDEDDTLLEEIDVRPGEVMLMFSGGHGYEITEDDTIVLEVKNGPYPGAEQDRRRLEGSRECGLGCPALWAGRKSPSGHRPIKSVMLEAWLSNGPVMPSTTPSTILSGCRNTANG